MLDVSKEIAPLAGIPTCNIDDPQVWPHDIEGKGLQSMSRTPHMNYHFGGQYWLNAYLRSNSHLLTDDIDKACMVWVDLYCYNQWLHSWMDGKMKRLPNATVEEPGHWQGQDYVFQVTHSGSIGVYGRPLCGMMRNSFMLVPTHGFICNKDRTKVERRQAEVLPYNAVAGIDLGRPIVGSRRDTFLYMRAGCTNSTKRSSGVRLRYYIVQEYEGLAGDVQVHCTCSICPGRKTHDEIIADYASSVFCPIIVGDNTGSVRLSEIVLAGCIPVFMAPPMHEMPLDFDVDYASFGVFLNITNSRAWNDPPTPFKIPRPARKVEAAVVTVPNLRAAYDHLRSFSPEAVRNMQAALERERVKLYFKVPPGRRSSVLAQLVFKNVMVYEKTILRGL
ncbi:Dihydrolipoyllysine-residue acetyltransferase component of pyruvate dehydrogenase complex [Micractinium conductrix]|uniref:Dihydrolipoyllysine-residue acetyltransferase component of pyruvate dehydrogenase complex n=1 Tax=Micractinium conductrix TaxID=554055 RepID=A0A2P6V962_9CHLO|nr:Dihydrolipoyllysine-residue acetyltransferase component of pyruvate dehydrogenase complex [Micractinium conductrix]|eukprot:PSC70619.1 Dihydrolipoyllysine-residue acetyltransferase component of pyruvate dehydrogenase complex [Micractinium conductrix]